MTCTCKVGFQETPAQVRLGMRVDMQGDLQLVPHSRTDGATHIDMLQGS